MIEMYFQTPARHILYKKRRNTSMRLSELREKEVINTCTCERLGCVADVEINITTGQVMCLIVPGPCKICGILGRDSEYIIPFSCVCQIGCDIILVNVNTEEVLQKCKHLP